MKRKILNKILASLVTVSMIACLAGCAKTDGEQGSQPNPTNQPSQGSNAPSGDKSTPAPTEAPAEDLGPYTILKDASGNPIDLGGMHIILRDWNTDPNAPQDDSAFAEARREYHDWLQKTYNFTFEQKAISTYDSTPEDFTNYVTGNGDDNNYIWMLYTGASTMSAMKNGLMYDVASLDCWDLTESKWHQGVKEMFSIGNKIYGFRHNEGIGGRGVYFNKRILKDAGINPDDLYKWQKNGEWTWSKFEEICKAVQKDTDNDGTPDVYGMACRNTIWFEIITHTNMGDFVAKDANGNLVNGLEKSETMEALNWALSIWETYDAHLSYPEDAAWDYFMQAYQEGKGCFYPGELWRAHGLTENMADELGFVCFPKGPKAKDYVNPVADNPCVIPACYSPDKAWKIAFAYNMWTAPVPEFEDYATWRVSGYNDFDDMESVDDTVATLMTNAKPTYNAAVPDIDLAGDIFYVVSKDNTPAQIAEAVRNKWQAVLDTANGVETASE